MFARLVVGILGGLLLGIAGAGLCMLAFGSTSGAWGLLLLWIAGLVVAIAAPDLTKASRWLLMISGIAVLLLVFSSAIVSDRLLPGAAHPLQPASHEEDTMVLLLGMLLGGLALFAGLWIGRDQPDAPRRHNESNDVTDNFSNTPAARVAISLQRVAGTARGHSHALQYTILGALLLFGGLLVWSNRSETGDPVPSTAIANVAPPTVAPASAEPPPAPAVPDAKLQPNPAASAPALTPSQVRQECMAQVEAARLFLGLARVSSSRGDYEVRIRDDVERFRREKPVGPRTLTLIASAMWSRRERADPDASVWSREYTRCEQVRSGGTFYVVRGQN
ncbi:MAG: hypothetical protein ABIT36_12510 [Steroidobacteraceae bacterium]